MAKRKEKAIRKTTKGKGANYRPTKKGAGMTAKGVKAYRKKNPGSKLKTAVTGKVKKGSKAAKRRKSYCARSLGQLKRSSAKTRNNPNSRIRQARRRWKCQMAKGVKHYLRNGTVWTGGMHKMSNGIMHTGKTHTKTSKRLYHFKDLSATAKKKARPKK